MGLEGTRLNLQTARPGRRSVAVYCAQVGEVSESDLVLLAGERGIKPRPIARLRDRHHAIARYLAQGLKEGEVAAITGYCLSRISVLKADPTFQNLVKHYQEVENSAQGEFIERATLASLTALAELQERLEEAPESFSTGDLLEVTKVTADRTGHAPVTKSVSINATIGMGDRLEQARQRSKAARVIDVQPVEK